MQLFDLLIVWWARIYLWSLRRSEKGCKFLSLVENWIIDAMAVGSGSDLLTRLDSLSEKVDAVDQRVIANPPNTSSKLNQMMIEANLPTVGLGDLLKARLFLETALMVILLQSYREEMQKAR